MFENTKGYPVYLMFMALPENGTLWFSFDNFNGFVPIYSNIQIREGKTNLMYQQNDPDDYAFAEGSTTACSREHALDSIRVARFAYPFSLYTDSIRLYLCPVAEEDAPMAISKSVSVTRMAPTLIDVETTDAENFAHGSCEIAISTEGLRGRLFAHKCPTTAAEEEELEFLPETPDQRIAAPRGTIKVCYQSPINGSAANLYGSEDKFSFEAMEFTDTGERVYGDLNWFKTETRSRFGAITIRFDSGVEALEAAHTVVQGGRNLTLTLGANDLQASTRPRELTMLVDVSSVEGGKLYDPVTQNALSSADTELVELAGDSVIFELPSSSFVDVLPAGSNGRATALALTAEPSLRFSYAVVATDADLNVSETSVAQSVTVRVEAAPQPLAGLACFDVANFAFPSALGVFAPLAGVQVNSYANADIFPVQVSLASTSSCGSSFLRASMSNVTVDFAPGTVAQEAVLEAPVGDYLELRYGSGTGRAWTSHALCLEHGCSSEIWLRGPRTAVNAVLASLEVSELCGSESLIVNITLVDPNQATARTAEGPWSCVADLRNATTEGSASSGNSDGAASDDAASGGTNMPAYGVVAIVLAGVAVGGKLASNSRLMSKCSKKQAEVDP